MVLVSIRLLKMLLWNDGGRAICGIKLLEPLSMIISVNVMDLIIAIGVTTEILKILLNLLLYLRLL